jgi:hypothetical protein
MRTCSLMALACLLVSACGTGPVAGASGVPGAARSPADTRTWVVHVTVAPSTAGAIEIGAGPVLPAQPNDAHPWMRHEIVFTNAGRRPVTFADTRTSAFLGGRDAPVLLAADQGCGYEKHPSRVRPGVCLAYLDAFTIEPGASVVRAVTLFEGLPGMRPLAEGAYVFEQPLRFGIGRVAPSAGAGRAVTVTLTYDVEPARG